MVNKIVIVPIHVDLENFHSKIPWVDFVDFCNVLGIFPKLESIDRFWIGLGQYRNSIPMYLKNKIEIKPQARDIDISQFFFLQKLKNENKFEIFSRYLPSLDVLMIILVVFFFENNNFCGFCTTRFEDVEAKTMVTKKCCWLVLGSLTSSYSWKSSIFGAKNQINNSYFLI